MHFLPGSLLGNSIGMKEMEKEEEDKIRDADRMDKRFSRLAFLIHKGSPAFQDTAILRKLVYNYMSFINSCFGVWHLSSDD